MLGTWCYPLTMTYPRMEQTFQQSYAAAKQSEPSVPIVDDAEDRTLKELLAAFPGLSLEVIAAAYTDADRDVNVAAEILATTEHHHHHVTEPPRFHSVSVNKSAAEETGCEDLLILKYGSGVGHFRGSTGIIRQPDPVVYHHIKSPTSESPQVEINRSNTFDLYSSNPHQKSGICVAGIKSPSSCTGIESSSASLPSLKLPPNVSDKISSGLYDASRTEISNRSTRIGTDDGPSGNEFNEVSDNGTSLHWKTSKKKKGDLIDVEELESKDAARRRAVAEFMHSMLGQGFHLGIDVVKDVVGYFQGDTKKIALSSSGLSLTSENIKLFTESLSQLDAKKPFVPMNPLQTLMEAFPDKDPAQVVMAFQKCKGDLELASSMLLKAGNGSIDRSFRPESTTNQMLEKEQSKTRALLTRLKVNFPTVDNTSLFEVLQSNSFSYRETVQTLMDAGLTPVKVKANHTDAMDLPQTILQNNPHNNGAQISACAQPLPAVWCHKGPVESALKSVPDGSATKKNPVHHFKSYVGELDDYDHLRRSANEHWRTMQYYFSEAAAAYGRGERCRAASLSEKGKVYKQLAQEASERASHRIFDSKNKDIENNITIDLHAQHVREAIQVLKLHLQTLSSVPSVYTLTVITGHGSHSSNGRAKIKPAVIKFLLKREISWREGNIGCLIIKMKDVRNKDLDRIGPESPT